MLAKRPPLSLFQVQTLGGVYSSVMGDAPVDGSGVEDGAVAAEATPPPRPGLRAHAPRQPQGAARMTWSIVAHDPATGTFAVAVATCNFAVGASCPFVRSGVGAVSTQSFTNRYLAPAILDALERGLAPAEAIESALVGDRGREIRQVHVVDRHGRSAAFTGVNCVGWCGDAPAEGFSVAGNML